ncbi:oleate hydratase [Streptomyces sp. NPDC007808]|uniref:oleate hydratase n=1 Tax=Streptomyces sp. NPDC007808 TaxID=3364779 RepID=UPI0036C3A9B8
MPEGSVNLAFIGQFAEVPDDVVFTVEYSVRTAWTAVAELLGLGRRPPGVYKGHHDPHGLVEALEAMHRRSPRPECGVLRLRNAGSAGPRSPRAPSCEGQRGLRVPGRGCGERRRAGPRPVPTAWASREVPGSDQGAGQGRSTAEPRNTAPKLTMVRQRAVAVSADG